MEPRHRNHHDVTDGICVADPAAVEAEVCTLLAGHDPAFDPAPIASAFRTYVALHAGALPGHAAADTPYHDAQHSLECALGTARLIDGHNRQSAASARISAERARLGIVIALFHDAGYVRRTTDSADNGAAYTLTHVQRSAEFLAALLPTLGFAAEVGLSTELVHFTGYERPLDALAVADPRDRLLGHCIATADLVVQTADRCYLEKCRDFLYPEFEIAGLAGPARPGGPTPLYANRDALLRGTPAFNARIRRERLDGAFGGVHRCFEAHFGRRDPYRAAIDANLERIEAAIAAGSFAGLRRRPEVVGPDWMRRHLAA